MTTQNQIPETLKNYDMYYAFKPLASNGEQYIHVSDINKSNWNSYIDGILNIMRDSIFTDWAHKVKIYYIFDSHNITVPLSIPDSFFNIMLWQMIIATDRIIMPYHIFFPKNITQKEIKKWVDKNFIDVNLTLLDNKTINTIIDNSIFQFTKINDFAMYLMNTINLEDFIDLAEKSPRFDEAIHPNLDNVPMDEIKDVGMNYAEIAIDEIKNAKHLLGYDHCLADSFRTGQGTNIKQFKEFAINIGPKPDGNGGVFPMSINRSFIENGLQNFAEFFMESSVGRTAQIYNKAYVRESGHLARILGLNNMESYIQESPLSDCNTHNFEEIVIKNKKYLELFKDRYYRFNPYGMEYCISENDYHLIGKKIYLRSPMTCASAARGEGICYKCYGKLAYAMNQVNCGKMAAETLSEQLTQRMLSAKHILEAKVISKKWVPEFSQWFDVDVNAIKLSGQVYKKSQFLIINFDDIILLEKDESSSSEEYSEDSYNEYISKFIIKDGNKEIEIHSENFDKLYISGELNSIIYNKSFVDNDRIVIPLDLLTEIDLFYVEIENNELAKVLEQIIDIINKREVTCSMDKNELLQKLIDITIEGGVNAMAVHCEVILSNQMRDVNDILKNPEWEYENEPYKILTLDQALVQNPSVTISMHYQKLGKALYLPVTFLKKAPSVMDIFMHPQPQRLLSNEPDEVLNKNGKINPIIHH